MTGETILIVEDHAIQREGVAAILRQHGYAVVTAADAEEGLYCLRSGPHPDLILLDMLVRRPGADGWNFLEERKRSAALSTIPVLIMTGITAASDEWAAGLGARGLLRKPFEVDALLTEIERCLGSGAAGGPGGVA
jgi:CheY-like chemotaxis protein